MLIKITRAEGPTEQCGKPLEFDSFAGANIQLRVWSNTAPEKGGYDKCDFTIEDEALGIDYAGRYDLKHWRDEAPSLQNHVLGFLSYVAGKGKPYYMDQEQYDRAVSRHTQEERDQAWQLHEVIKALS